MAFHSLRFNNATRPRFSRWLLLLFPNVCVPFSQLLTAGANPKARGINGELPLALAALRPSTPKSASIVEALLRAGADPNAYSTRGIPILHTACGAVRGDGSTVELLIKAGAGVNAPSPGDDFVTPLHVAARSNNAPAVRILTAINRCKLNIQSSTLCRLAPCTVGMYA